MQKPLVSVKMLTYNHAPFIARAIEGVVRQQTGFPFELVIGEDCSTDGTREIVFEYRKKHPDIVRVLTSDSNVGMNANGRRVSLACRGKYIAFCEGDDYWQDPRKLQKQADHLESHPECALVHSSYDVQHVGSKKVIHDYIRYKKWNVPGSLRISDFVENSEISHLILTCTVMVRRKLAEAVIEADPYLHQNDRFLMGDTQLWAEIAARAPTHYIPESLATYTVTEESASRSRSVTRSLHFSISCSEMFLYLCDKYNRPGSRRKHETAWCDYSLRLAFQTKDKTLADEVRKRKKTFTAEEWLRYYGARNTIVHSLFRAAAFFHNLFRRKKNHWLRSG